ncbi:hypothetical protein A5778_22485 [Mycolicibacterium monacense]|nr:hypothetical protein A5778_22485 [Mycolicibacterium monacense]
MANENAVAGPPDPSKCDCQFAFESAPEQLNARRRSAERVQSGQSVQSFLNPMSGIDLVGGPIHSSTITAQVLLDEIGEPGDGLAPRLTRPGAVEVMPKFGNEGGQRICAVRFTVAVVGAPLEPVGEICVCSFTLCGSPPPESTIPIVTMDDSSQAGNSLPSPAGDAAVIS